MLFIVGERLYRIHCLDMADWYDVPPVVAAINKALEDSGAPNRFIPLATDGQDAAYLFTEPAIAGRATALNLFELELSDDAAREAGQASEETVRRSVER